MAEKIVIQSLNIKGTSDEISSSGNTFIDLLPTAGISINVSEMGGGVLSQASGAGADDIMPAHLAGTEVHFICWVKFNSEAAATRFVNVNADAGGAEGMPDVFGGRASTSFTIQTQTANSVKIFYTWFVPS